MTSYLSFWLSVVFIGRTEVTHVEEARDSKQLRKRFKRMLATLIVAALAAVMVTYAWYIYNANRHITDVKMAAGTGVTFLISDSYDGEYKSSAGLSFQGLLNPVSTDNILNGFQKVVGFTGGDTQDSLLATFFGPAQHSDYYKTSLYLATSSLSTDVCLSDIRFDDIDSQNPVSTALRVGLVVHQPGENQPVAGQYVFELTQAHNPQARYNTKQGKAGDVLDSTKTDGSTVPFTPLNSTDYCEYNEEEGVVTKPGAKLATLPAALDGANHSTPVQVDVYVWLEGCDEDCTNNLCGTSLASLALHFAGSRE